MKGRQTLRAIDESRQSPNLSTTEDISLRFDAKPWLPDVEVDRLHHLKLMAVSLLPPSLAGVGDLEPLRFYVSLLWEENCIVVPTSRNRHLMTLPNI